MTSCASLGPTCGGDRRGMAVEHRRMRDLDRPTLVTVFAVAAGMAGAARGARRFDLGDRVLVVENVKRVFVIRWLCAKQESAYV